jgi:hypothetical protein
MRVAEAEVRLAAVLKGKSDEVVRVYSKPDTVGVMIVEFASGDHVEIEVRV